MVCVCVFRALMMVWRNCVRFRRSGLFLIKISVMLSDTLRRESYQMLIKPFFSGETHTNTYLWYGWTIIVGSDLRSFCPKNKNQCLCLFSQMCKHILHQKPWEISQIHSRACGGHDWQAFWHFRLSPTHTFTIATVYQENNPYVLHHTLPNWKWQNYLCIFLSENASAINKENSHLWRCFQSLFPSRDSVHSDAFQKHTAILLNMMMQDNVIEELDDVGWKNITRLSEKVGHKHCKKKWFYY